MRNNWTVENQPTEVKVPSLLSIFLPRSLQWRAGTVSTMVRLRTLAVVVDAPLCHNAAILCKRLGKLVQENKKIKDCNNFSDSGGAEKRCGYVI